MEMRDCINDEQLNIYLDGELTEAEKATVEAHLNTCDRCATRAKEMCAVGQALRTVTMKAVDEADFSQVWSRVKAEAFPPKPEEEPRRSWLDGLLASFRTNFSPVSAVALLLIVAGIVYFSGLLQPRPTPPQPVMEAAADNEAQIFSIESDSRAVMVLQSPESGATIIIVSDIGSETETNQEPTI